jgi:hypothetical protein
VKRVLIIAALVPVGAALAVTGLVLGGSAHAAPARPAASPSQTVVFGCPGQHALVKPRSFVLTCADGYAYFARLSWTSWVPGLASAKGTLVLNDCTPYCAAGHFHSYPAIVVLWGSKPVKGHPGERSYTQLTEILTGPRPRHMPMTQTVSLLASGHAG